MDLATLDIFHIVAAEMSVTKAAARLGRAQSNVSTRIQQLEEELGVQLFVRDGNRLRLSEAGITFLDYARRLLALADEARQAMHPTRPGGVLRIGAMESTAATRLPSIVSAFHQQWLSVDLKVSTGHSQALVSSLNSDLIDCAFLALAPHEKTSAEALLAAQNLVGQAVFKERIMLLVSASHPFARQPDDSELRLAAFKSGCSYRALGQQWVAAHWPDTARGMEIQDVNSYDEMIARVAAGQCASFVPQSVLDRNGPLDGVRVTHALDADTWLVRRKGYATPAFTEFCALTLQAADEGAIQ